MAMSKDDIQGKKVYPVTKDSMSNRIALLINNIDFNDKTLTRHGAEQDQQAMLNLLHHLQYEVVIHQDLTAEGIDQALIKFSKHSKLIKTDSVFVVVMSHGGLGTTSGSDQVDFEIDKIYERLNTKNCPALIDKPKVIIIQACRGENEGVVKLAVSRQSLATENIDSPSKNGKAGVVYVEKDFIGFHSSTPYTYSYRHPKRGSHFIHHICDVFQAACCQDHIEELLKKVKQHFEESPSEHKQMPTIERNTLTKYFYLFPDAVQNRHNQPRLQSLPPDKLLFSVRKQFVEKVSDSTLNLLLDSLVQRRIINMEEMELAKIKHRPDRARNVIDIVRNKGERASSSMIADLHQMDPYLSEILGLN